MSARTIYAWRKHFGSFGVERREAATAAGAGNGPLKKMVPDRGLEIDVLEITRKEWQVQACAGSRWPTLKREACPAAAPAARVGSR